jgi:nucleoid-associated protein YgaU
MAGQLLKYVTEPGDNLWDLARRFYNGNAEGWRRIFDLNAAVLGNNPNYLIEGTTLHIPTDEPVYTVQEGDTLHSIARQFFRDANAHMRIYNANRWRYPEWTDPEQVQPGMELHIPVQEVEHHWRDSDTPEHVAAIYYGDRRAAPRIIAANPDRVFAPPLDNPQNPIGFTSYPVIIP